MTLSIKREKVCAVCPYLLFDNEFSNTIADMWGRMVIRISGSRIWLKTLMKLIFNPSGEFRWSPEGPVSQIHSPHLNDGATGIFSNFLKVCSDAKEKAGCGKQREATALIHP